MTDETTSEPEKVSGGKRRLEYCQEWHRRLESDYRGLKDNRELARKFRDSDSSIVTVLENRSSMTTTDMQDAIDMAKPDILEQIAGIDEPLKLDPDEAKYVEPVKKLQVLGNVMVKRKNQWFRICSDFLDDSMILQFGCIKYAWVEEATGIVKEYGGLDDIVLQSLLAKEGAKLVSDVPASPGEGEDSQPKERFTKIKYSTTDEYVKYYGVPSERIKFPLDTKDLANAPIVIEEVCLYEHEFIKMYGKDNFKKVKKKVEECTDKKADKEFEERFKHLGGVNHAYDKKAHKYKAYECYFWEDEKPWMLTYSYDFVFDDVENKYDKPPYRGGSAFLVAHALIGKGYMDLMKDIMRSRTNLRRQIDDTITQQNFRRYFANLSDLQMDIDAYENNTAMNALIDCKGEISERTLRLEEKPTLGGDIFTYWEILKSEKDEHTPTPRSFGGLEGGKDERTYRGKQLKVNQASKKLLMMMRGYMEEVFGPLFQDTLDCIAKFMKQKTVVRYLNEDYDIDPEDIICKYALIVNVGLGAHDKQDLIVKMQQLIGLALQQIELGIYTPQNLYYINSELVKAMGFLNTMDFVTDPQFKQTIMEFVQAVVMMVQHFEQLHQQDPEMQQLTGHMSEMIQQVMSALGIKPPAQQGGANSKGTATGQAPAAIQAQPANAQNPQQQISGGGFTA